MSPSYCVLFVHFLLQFYVDASYTDLKLPLEILIGTVPLRESFRPPPAPQAVITMQPASAPLEPDMDNFELREFWLFCCYLHAKSALDGCYYTHSSGALW